MDKEFKEKLRKLGLSEGTISRYSKLFTKEELKEFIKKEPKERAVYLREQTCLKKYGVKNPSNIKGIVEKRKQTMLNKYGVEHYNQLPSQKQKVSNNMKGNTYGLGQTHNSFKAKQTYQKHLEEELENLSKDRKLLTVKEASGILDVDPSYLNRTQPVIKGMYSNYILTDVVEKLKEQLKGNKGSSFPEKEIVDYLKSIYKGLIIENDRKIIYPKELDIYIPEKNLAIEFNGLYWHNDKVRLGCKNIPDRDKRIFAKFRHLEKTKLCEEKGIRLIHIFEDDWLYKKDIIKDILKQGLGISDSIIYARNCKVGYIESKTYREFLDTYHLQGYSPADLRIGLFYNNELVECIGIKTKGNHSKEPELVRLCSKQGVNVIGGFSKLLKHSNITHLVSYIDRATFSGKGYKKTGWKTIKVNPPTFFWLDVSKNVLIQLAASKLVGL